MSLPIERLSVWRRWSDGSQAEIGTLAQNKQATYFQYNDDYLSQGYSLSPFALAFNKEVQAALKQPHAGLHGIFADSLPDGWGMLLIDRVFRQNGILPHQLTPMDRLAYIGDRGMGALVYKPLSKYARAISSQPVNIVELGEQAQAIFEGATDQVLVQLAQAGSSGGARPKAQIYWDIDNPKQAYSYPKQGMEPWLVKFTSSSLALGHEEGICEAAYLQLAKQAGIHTTEWKLVTLENKPALAWLAQKRFDCSEFGRYHVHSACGLLDADFRLPSLDYEDLIKVSQVLCKTPQAAQEQFKRALFNLFALNQDDHSKNWSFLQNDKGEWSLSPFYDVTFSPTPYGEHSTAFSGYGKQPPVKVIQALAAQANFSSWKETQHSIVAIVDSLSNWEQVAKSLGVPVETRKLITQQLNAVYQVNKGLLSS